MRCGHLSVSSVFAGIGFAEVAGASLLPPNRLSRSSRSCSERHVALLQIPCDRRLSVLHAIVIAVVNNCAGHAAEYGLDDIEELCLGGQSQYLDLWRM